MSRCIHCTRCIRFSEEVVGQKLLGMFLRTNKSEVGSYVAKNFDSNISGNIIDLCPVGALTSRIYGFKARPWELKISDSIDLTDSFGSAIFVATKETSVIRITPKKSKGLNTIFISDKARFSFDAITNLRLLGSFRLQESTLPTKKLLVPTCIQSFLSTLRKELKKLWNLLIIPEDLDFQALNVLLSLSTQSGNSLRVYTSSNTHKAVNTYDQLSSFIFDKNTRTNVCFLFSSDLQIENTFINLKIRELFLKSVLSVFSVGFCSYTSFPVRVVTLNSHRTISLFEAKSQFTKVLQEVRAPTLIWGNSLAARFIPNFLRVFLLKKIKGSRFLILNRFANSESFKILNVKRLNTSVVRKAKILLAWNLEDTIYIGKIFLLLEGKIKIFWAHSHHTSLGKKANFLIPTLTHFELGGTFINLEGSSQRTHRSVLNLNPHLINISFLTAFFKGYYSTQDIKLESTVTFFLEAYKTTIVLMHLTLSSLKTFSVSPLFFNRYPFKPSFENFYQTDSFTKNSLSMYKRSREIRRFFINFL